VHDRVLAGVQARDTLVIKTCFDMEGVSYLVAEQGKPVFVTCPVVSELPQGELEERWAQTLLLPNDAVVFDSFSSEMFLALTSTLGFPVGIKAREGLDRINSPPLYYG
jgi:hypothetical protein